MADLDYDGTLELSFDTISSPGILLNHDGTQYRKMDNKDSEVQEDDLLPTRRNRKCMYMEPQVRKLAIVKMLDELKVLKATPLRPIKQVELWQKWGIFYQENNKK